MVEYNTVTFTNCSNCGRDWKAKFDTSRYTKEEFIAECEEFDELFGDHCCQRCSWRKILISLAVNAGKEVDFDEIDRLLKDKYGY